MATTNKRHKKANPRIYVVSQADLTAGKELGVWIDATQEPPAIHDEIREMLKKSKEPDATRWLISDYKGFGTKLQIWDDTELEVVAEVAKLVVKYGEMFAELAAYFEGVSDLEPARNCMVNGYYGAYKNVRDYIEQFLAKCHPDSMNNLPDIVRHNIDYKGIARKMERGEQILTIKYRGVVHVFDGKYIGLGSLQR